MPFLVSCLGYGSLLLVMGSLVLVLLPSRLAGKLPKLVRRLRTRLLATVRRARELSAQGPFYRLGVWCGRKLGRGHLASLCVTPDVRAKPSGNREVQVTLGPHLPYNPFHEEDYVLAWRREDESDDRWREKRFSSEHDCEKVAGRLRVHLDGLPEHTALVLRGCAEHIRGRSPWSKEARVATMAKPGEDGGFVGPLGQACPPEARYTWSQTQTEVSFKVPLRAEWKAKDIRFKWTPLRLEIRCAHGTIANGTDADNLLVGPMPKKVKTDEVFWSIEEDDTKLGRHLAVQMVKAEQYEKWPCLIEGDGHPHIDVRLLRFFTEGPGGFGGG